MKKFLLLTLTLGISFKAYASEVPEVFKTINKTYNLICEGPEYDNRLNILAIKAYPEQNKLVVGFSDFNKKTRVGDNVENKLVLDLFDQKVLVNVSQNDDSIFGGKTRNYEETKYSNLSISFEKTSSKLFKNALDYGFYLKFDDTTLNAGTMIRSFYWRPKNIEARCRFKILEEK